MLCEMYICCVIKWWLVVLFMMLCDSVFGAYVAFCVVNMYIWFLFEKASGALLLIFLFFRYSGPENEILSVPDYHFVRLKPLACASSRTKPKFHSAVEQRWRK